MCLSCCCIRHIDLERRVARIRDEIFNTGENLINVYCTYTIYTSKCAGEYHIYPGIIILSIWLLLPTSDELHTLSHINQGNGTLRDSMEDSHTPSTSIFTPRRPHIMYVKRSDILVLSSSKVKVSGQGHWVKKFSK